MLLLAIIVSLLASIVVPPVAYYSWIKSKAKMNWRLASKEDYRPHVSLIIATYNEAQVIGKKLENVQITNYPQDKLQVILVDSASTDDTLGVCKAFLENNELRFPVKLLSEEKRLGKSHALNTGLEYAEGEIIATSDADSFWEPDALIKAVSFFADPSVGAVTGREVLTNLEKNVHTMSEGIYRRFYYTLRLGESKVNSTLIFQGEFSLYRRSALQKFEDRAGYSDDTGTIVKMISRGYRCIFVPEAVFQDTAASSLNGRLMLKSRRAQHLVAGVIWSFRLKVKGLLPLSWPIVLFNFYWHVISPLLLMVTISALAFGLILRFQVFWFLLLLAIPMLIVKQSRLFLISYLMGNFALIVGLFRHVMGNREVTWQKVDEMRQK